MQTLDDIALSLPHIPDKSSMGHNYTAVYDRHFSPYRDKPIRLLEIGVAEGPSLALWSRYFTQASIVGADIDLARCKLPLPERCRLWEMNQASHESLVNMALHLAPWDIIIDDGSHDAQHQITSFKALWPFLNAGGLYCIEDLHVNYFPGYTDGCVRFIGGMLQDELHGRGKTSFARIENNTPAEQEKLSGRELEIESIHLYRYLCIINKR